ncbi:MAG: PAS-domain containing protein, partial [Rhodospirillaceae bacterium]
RRAFRFQSEALIATSHRLAGTLVDSTVDEIMVIETTVDQSRIVTILLLIFAFVSAFLVGWHLVLKGIVRPIAKVETTMGQIAGGDVSAPLPAETNDEVGKMVQALSRLRDYVARVVDAEEAVRQKTNLLQGVLASLNQGVVACDKDLKVIIHNQRFLDLHQYPKELVFEGQDFPELLHHDIARQEYGYSSINDLLDELNDRAESPDPHHYERLRPNGVYLDVRGGPLPDGGFVSAATDISLRKEAERKLAEAHKQITASIEYASIIQRSLLVSNQARFALLGPHFVIWEPRNVVGGDVYWVRSWGGGVLVGLGDCTGHGVPGAFVTLIATSALDLALPMIEPGDVAALMRQVHLNIQSLLGQDMANSLSNDGMDAGFLYLPTGSDQIRYCGANMPLFLVANGAVEQIKGTRYGVGYSDVPETHHYGENILDRTRYDALVMASDGIFDQIGGPRKKGFGKQRLMEVLADASHEPLDRVGEKTLAALTAYQGDCRRLDDVSAIGLSCRADTELLSEKDHA